MKINGHTYQICVEWGGGGNPSKIREIIKDHEIIFITRTSNNQQCPKITMNHIEWRGCTIVRNRTEYVFLIGKHHIIFERLVGNHDMQNKKFLALKPRSKLARRR
jgi:hypothetical protein